MELRHAIILAGGRGKRLGTLGNELPKVLIPIGGKPLVERHCEILSQSGITRVRLVVSRHYRYAFTSLSRPLALSVVFETSVRGPIRALMAQGAKLRAPALFLMGDVYFKNGLDIDTSELSRERPAIFGAMRCRHRDLSDNCHLTIARTGSRTGLITAIRDKPDPAQVSGTWAWNGWLAVHPIFFRHLRSLHLRQSELRDLHMGEVFERLRQSGVPLLAQKQAGTFVNINHPSDLARATRMAQ